MTKPLRFEAFDTVPWHGIECFSKVKYSNINLFVIFNILSPVVDSENQLRDTRVLLSEHMLFRCEDIIVFKVTRNVRMNNVF